VILLDPELEIWVWSDSPEVDGQLGWAQRQPDLRTWLRQKGLLLSDQAKPERPKEAMKAALREVKEPWSSSIHQHLAERVSLRRCTDPGFTKLKDTLRRWFPRV
jgi:phage antirepressor YoqD-like protein